MGSSRLEKTIINVATSFLAKFFTIGLQFVSRMIFVRFLSEEYLGINGLFTNVLAVLCLADLGMNTAMTYSLYAPIAQKDEEKIASLISFFKKIYKVIALFVLCVGLLLTPFLRFIINLEKPIDNLELYYWLFLANTVFSYLFVYRTTLLVADQKEYVLNRYKIIFQIITFTAKTITIVLFRNFVLFLLIGDICILIENIIENKLCYKYYPYLKKNVVELPKEEKKNIFENVKSLFMYRFSGVIQTNTDTILISIFVGTITVGYYSNYSMVITAIVSIITIIYNSVKASLGNMLADGISLDEKYNLFKVMEQVTFWIVGFSSVCFLVLMQDFISLAFGSQYLLSYSLLIVLIINFYITNIRQAMWSYRETTGIFQQTKYITLVTATINIFLSVLLGYYFGMLGIILATIIAKMAYAWWKEPQILYGEYFKKPVKEYFIRYMVNFFVLILISLITYKISEFFTMSNILIRFIYKMIICTIVSNILIGIYILPSKEGKYLVSRITKKLKN